MPHPTHPSAMTQTSAFQRYLFSLGCLIKQAFVDGDVTDRQIQAMLNEARFVGKRQREALADLEAMKTAVQRRATIDSAHRWEKIMALLFSLLRRHDQQNPNASPMTRKIREQFQQNGTYAALTDIREYAEQAHKDLAALAERHPDLPI
jgi:hypothetical protein